MHLKLKELKKKKQLKLKLIFLVKRCLYYILFNTCICFFYVFALALQNRKSFATSFTGLVFSLDNITINILLYATFSNHFL